MEWAGIVLVVVVVAVLLRLLAGSMDRDRIESYLRERGSTLRSKSWAPFGKGWVGEERNRIYEIEYEDRHGEIRRATVKTSLLGGVYLTDDRAVRRGRASAAHAPADEREALRAENARLAAELERLKQQGH